MPGKRGTCSERSKRSERSKCSEHSTHSKHRAVSSCVRTCLVASHVSAMNMITRPVKLNLDSPAAHHRGAASGACVVAARYLVHGTTMDLGSPALAILVPRHSATIERVTRREGTSTRVT